MYNLHACGNYVLNVEFLLFQDAKPVGMATAVKARAVKTADFLTINNTASVMKMMAGAVMVRYPRYTVVQ